MKCLATFTVVSCALIAGCNTEGRRVSALSETDTTDDKAVADDARGQPRTHARVAVSVGARDGQPLDRFTSTDEVFITAFAASELGNTDEDRDYFFRVVDKHDEDVSRSDTACRRIRIGRTGRIETLYANGDEACPHNSAVDRIHGSGVTHGIGGVTVGLAPFGDADALVDGVSFYEVQLAPVERFTGFQEPAFVAAFVLDLRVATTTTGPMDRPDHVDRPERSDRLDRHQ